MKSPGKSGAFFIHERAYGQRAESSSQQAAMILQRGNLFLPAVCWPLPAKRVKLRVLSGLIESMVLQVIG